jgi:hypothetical protein
VTCSVGTLIQEACESGFKCLDEQQYRALVLQLLCNLSSGIGPSFESGLLSPAAGVIFAGPHGLGVVPSRVRAVTVATTFDLNMAFPVGTETDITSWFDSGSISPEFALSADATNIYLSSLLFVSGPGESNCQTQNIAGNLGNPASINNFRLKVYAWT